jgi:hypothetical protein
MRATVCALFSLALLCAGCGPEVDLSKGLQVEVVSTGWFDAGIVNGHNKLVPTVTFKIKNVSDQKLSALQVNARFSRGNEPEEWGNGFLPSVGPGGLAPGATTAPLTIKSQLGYTGTDQSRVEMLQNSQFVDAKVELAAKHGGTQWKRLGEYPIARQLITP